VTLAERLRVARELSGLTQMQAAELALDPMTDGTYRYQTISEFERGLRIPTAPELARLCEAYEASADWLLLERGPIRVRNEEGAAAGVVTEIEAFLSDLRIRLGLRGNDPPPAADRARAEEAALGLERSGLRRPPPTGGPSSGKQPQKKRA
jgi:transcriptional regulator with XRE-family HTH domain